MAKRLALVVNELVIGMRCMSGVEGNKTNRYGWGGQGRGVYSKASVARNQLGLSKLSNPRV